MFDTGAALQRRRSLLLRSLLPVERMGWWVLDRASGWAERVSDRLEGLYRNIAPSFEGEEAW